MSKRNGSRFAAVGCALLIAVPLQTHPGHHGKGWDHDKNASLAVQLGPRPAYLVDDMEQGWLKRKLSRCDGPFEKSDFSIGHRGAPLQFPEHTRESYLAAARMGAGILECDVTFTKDRELVCRHSQCDLHTTTNILAIPELAKKCTQTFEPAQYDPEGNLAADASAKCCTSDITLAEFRMLKGKMDASDPTATTVADYLGGTADWRTDLYAAKGTLMTHAESIELFKALGVKMMPELKSPSVAMPYEGEYTQEDYAQQLIEAYKQAGVPARHVWAQSFDLGDVLYWISSEPRFGRQAVYLDGRYDEPTFDHRRPETWEPNMKELADMGVNIIAPPMWMLVKKTRADDIAPSRYAKRAKSAGLGIITWTLERSGPLVTGGGWYYRTLNGDLSGEKGFIDNDGDTMEVLDVLAREVGVLGVFSDWPATTTYYANCMGIGDSKRGPYGRSSVKPDGDDDD